MDYSNIKKLKKKKVKEKDYTCMQDRHNGGGGIWWRS